MNPPNALGILKCLSENQGVLMAQENAELTQTFLSEHPRSNSHRSSQHSGKHVNACLAMRSKQSNT